MSLLPGCGEPTVDKAREQSPASPETVAGLSIGSVRIHDKPVTDSIILDPAAGGSFEIEGRYDAAADTSRGDRAFVAKIIRIDNNMVVTSTSMQMPYRPGVFRFKGHFPPFNTRHLGAPCEFVVKDVSGRIWCRMPVQLQQ